MMNEMIFVPYWFWIIVSGLLLMIEIIGTKGYALWTGTAALFTALLSWLFPLTFLWQCFCFSLLTLISAIMWWYFLSFSFKRKRQHAFFINQREQQLIGTRLILTMPLENRQGRVKIGDSTWKIRASQDISIGTEIEVTGIDGITLIVTPLSI